MNPNESILTSPDSSCTPLRSVRPLTAAHAPHRLFATLLLLPTLLVATLQLNAADYPIPPAPKRSLFPAPPRPPVVDAASVSNPATSPARGAVPPPATNPNPPPLLDAATKPPTVAPLPVISQPPPISPPLTSPQSTGPARVVPVSSLTTPPIISPTTPIPPIIPANSPTPAPQASPKNLPASPAPTAANPAISSNNPAPLISATPPAPLPLPAAPASSPAPVTPKPTPTPPPTPSASPAAAVTATHFPPPANATTNTATANSKPAAATDPFAKSPGIPTTTVPDDFDFKIRAATDSNNVPFHLEALVKSSTNLISKADPLRQDLRQKKLAEFQAQLDVARQQRRDKETARAINTLQELLNSDAPTGFKRPALYELALAHHEDGQLLRAQQIFGQYLKTYPDDPMTPEIYLRQGIIYRQLGTHNLAIGRFYAVMNSAINLKLDRIDYYRTLVLHAQTEIADTYFSQTKYTDAADFYQRLLKLPGTELNRPQIQFKLVRSLALLDRHLEAIGQGKALIDRYPTAPEVPETHYQVAMSHKALNQPNEALNQVLTLLQSQQAAASKDPANWAYWQQRTGNEIANHFYKENDDLNALTIYLNLAKMSATPAWQLPALYQAGLVYERLRQPAKATETYNRITQRAPDVDPKASPALASVLDMARWRKDHLAWQDQADRRTAALRTLPPEFRTATLDATINPALPADTLAPVPNPAPTTLTPITATPTIPTPTFAPIGSAPPVPIKYTPLSTPAPTPANNLPTPTISPAPTPALPSP